MTEPKLSLSRQIMDAREAITMIQRGKIALGVNGWSEAEIDRVLAGLHAAGETLEWLARNEEMVKAAVGKARQ